MKFKIDENLPVELAEDLRAAGHDADTVADEGLTGATDLSLLAKAQSDGRALLTLDKGVADIRAYPPQNYFGIILFRPPSSGRKTTLEFVRRHLTSILQHPLSGQLYVVSETGIRKR